MALMRNFELTVFKLAVHFNIEHIGNWQIFNSKFELNATSD